MDWEDILIIGLDEGRTQSSMGEIWEVHFLLSAPAPPDWQGVFAEVTKKSLDSQKPHADAKPDSVSVRCGYDEIEHQLATLKEIVATVNARYREMLEEADRQKEQADRGRSRDP